MKNKKHCMKAPILRPKAVNLTKAKKTVAILLSLALICAGIRGIAVPASKAETDYGLSNPRVEMLTRDVIEFGSYWQEDTNGDGVADQRDEKTPVKWQILSEEDTDGDGRVDDLFLLADRVLDAKAYDEDREHRSAIWETSTLRTWLNGEFYDVLFTEEEKNAVKEIEVENENNQYYGTAGGNDTKDHLFLLSLSDIMNISYDFLDAKSLYGRARTTGYAKENGISSNADGIGMWWLRSPGSSINLASDFHYSSVNSRGINMRNSQVGVRPALHVNIAISSKLKNKLTEEEITLSKSTWDTVEFGNYNGVKITWRVLAVNGDDAFLL